MSKPSWKTHRQLPRNARVTIKDTKEPESIQDSVKRPTQRLKRDAKLDQLTFLVLHHIAKQDVTTADLLGKLESVNRICTSHQSEALESNKGVSLEEMESITGDIKKRLEVLIRRMDDVQSAIDAMATRKDPRVDRTCAFTQTDVYNTHTVTSPDVTIAPETIQKVKFKQNATADSRPTARGEPVEESTYDFSNQAPQTASWFLDQAKQNALNFSVLQLSNNKEERQKNVHLYQKLLLNMEKRFDKLLKKIEDSIGTKEVSKKTAQIRERKDGAAQTDKDQAFHHVKFDEREFLSNEIPSIPNSSHGRHAVPSSYLFENEDSMLISLQDILSQNSSAINVPETLNQYNGDHKNPHGDELNYVLDVLKFI